MKKRSAKIREQLLDKAKSHEFETTMTLYIKEAVRLMNEGFQVARVFSKEHDHPERESYLYVISWQDPTSTDGFASKLYEITFLTLI